MPANSGLSSANSGLRKEAAIDVNIYYGCFIL